MSIADIAAALPWPVFACGDDKRPVVETGFKAATRDAATIRAQFSRPAATLIGVPTGVASGLVVIDVDIKGEKDGRRWLNVNSSDLPTTRTHKTRSGGLHLLFRAPANVEIRNSASKLAPGVDVRGEGGYIIVPPSTGYTVADDTPPAEMPEWLVNACMRQQTPQELATQRPSERLEKYTQAAIDGEVLAVMRAAEGTRNDTLNKAAVKLGTLVAAGQVSRSTVEQELQRAAHLSGLDPKETAATIKSGMDFGTARPREMPESRQAAPNRAEPRVTRDGTPPPDRFPLLWFHEIEPVLDAKDFVQGVLVEGSAAVVYGESNAGKTFFTTDLALHVAAGLTWQGKRVEQGGVIYCVLEGGIGFKNRVTAWKSAHNLDQIPFAAIPSSMNLLDPEADTRRLITTIKAAQEEMDVPVKLVVIDTLARAFAGGNENSSEDMGALVLNMDDIRAETGAMVLFVHHSGKDQARGARGHSSLRAAIDTEIEVVADPNSERKTATCVKQRDMSKGAVFGFALEVVSLGLNRHGEDVTTCVVSPTDPDEAGQGGTSKGPRLTGNAQIALSMLHRALSKNGAVPPPSRDFPDNVTVIPAEMWRHEFYSGGKPGEPADTKRKAFNRAREELVRLRVVACVNDLVWVVRSGT